MDTFDKIQRLILIRGLSDTDFAIKAGVYRTSLAEWRKGKTKSYLKHLPQIASALGVSADELLDDKDEKNTPEASASGVVDIELNKIISNLSDENKQKLLELADLLETKQNS